jgi:hypothetical protein
MYSIILTREANTEPVREILRKFLHENQQFIVTELAPMHYYSGFLIQENLNPEQIEEIWGKIKELSSQSCIFFEKGIRFIQAIDPPRPFDFEDYDDTSLGGPGMEMDIMNLIDNAHRTIDECVDNPTTKKQAINSVANLWIEKIKEWVDLHTK